MRLRRTLLALACVPPLAGCGDALRAANAAWAEFTRPDPPEHVFKTPVYAAAEPAPATPAPRDLTAQALAALPTAAIQPADPPIVRRPLPPRLKNDAHVTAAKRRAPTKPSGDAAHWGYAGAGGPERWGGLDPAFAACDVGTKQSPIDLKGAEEGRLLPALVFYYRSAPLTLRNNGHTVQADLPPGSWLDLGGVRYDLRQFHFHAPSEHTVEGTAALMEAHLVHENVHGQLAVLGVMISPGNAANATLAAVLRHAPREEGVRHLADVTLDPKELLPEDRSYWRYVGSLTTPPCSEGVAWHVLQQPITATRALIGGLMGLMPHHNARPVQPLGSRTLVRK